MKGLDQQSVEIPKLTLGQPDNVSVRVVKKGLLVNWSAVAEADRYYVERQASDGDWTKIGYKTGTSFTDKTAESGTVYRYRVYASRSAEKVKGPKAARSAKKLFLAAPTLSSVKNAAEGVLIKWETVEGAAKYQIYKKTGENGKWVKLKVVADTTYTDTKVKSGKEYSYRVRCLNANGKLVNTYSATKSILYLARPKILSATKDKNRGAVSLKWDEVKGAAQYNIFRKNDDGKYILCKMMSSPHTKCSIVQEKGKKYWYKVIAVNGKTESAASQAVSYEWAYKRKTRCLKYAFEAGFLF